MTKPGKFSLGEADDATALLAHETIGTGMDSKSAEIAELGTHGQSNGWLDSGYTADNALKQSKTLDNIADGKIIHRCMSIVKDGSPFLY